MSNPFGYLSSRPYNGRLPENKSTFDVHRICHNIWNHLERAYCRFDPCGPTDSFIVRDSLVCLRPDWASSHTKMRVLSDPLSNSASPTIPRSADLSLTGMIPSKAKTFRNLATVQCPLQVILFRSWSLRAVVCSSRCCPSPQSTILHLFVPRHSPAGRPPLEQTHHKPTLRTFSRRTAPSSSKNIRYFAT